MIEKYRQVREITIECRLCKNGTIEPVQSSLNYYWCNNCDVIFMDESYVLTLKDEKRRYLQHNNNIANKGYVDMLENFINSGVLPYASSCKNALDFGCGPGPVLKLLLEKRGIKTDIYDIYFFPEKVYANNKYDLITATEVVEHLINPLEVWDIFNVNLNEGGYIAIMTLFHPGIDDFSKWWYKKDPTHVSFYSKKTFQWIERNYPFRIIFSNDYNILTMKKSDGK